MPKSQGSGKQRFSLTNSGSTYWDTFSKTLVGQ